MSKKTSRLLKNPKVIFDIFGKKTEPAKLTKKRINIETQKHGTFTWIDVQNPTSAAQDAIGRHYNLQPIHTNKSLSVSHIARMETETNYLFLLLHFPRISPSTGKMVTHQVIIYLGKNFLVTVHDDGVPTIRRVFDDYVGKNSPETKSSAHILYQLLAAMLEDIEKLIQGVSLEIDEIGINVFDDDESDAKRISQLRQKIVQLRRTMTTQKNILSELDGIIDKFTGERIGRYYTANTNRSIKLWETVEEARETIEIYKDADFTSSQERTNEILAILTIIFTLSIPATTIGALYGMNVLLPGGIETGPWNFWGTYTTLIVILIAVFLPALLMYVYFKRNKWF